MLSKEAAILTTTDFTSKATSYFNALFTNKDVNGVSITPTYTTTGGSQVVITATGTMPTTVLKTVGFAYLDIDVASTVKWGNTRLRVALVLDNTGSMSSAGSYRREDRDHQSAGPAADRGRKDGDVYVSIIPFVKDVAVDPTINYSANWIDWTEWLAEPQVLDTTKSGSKPSNWYTTGSGSTCPFPIRRRNSSVLKMPRVPRRHHHRVERQRQGSHLSRHRHREEEVSQERCDVQRLLQ